MDIITIEATEHTPKVILDHIKSRFEIIGDAYPENSKEFYAPLIKWLDDYYNYLYFMNEKNNSKKDLVFIIHLTYVSSSSLKFTLNFLQGVEKLMPLANSIAIKWLFNKGDEDMEENGVEFSSMVGIPFTIAEA